MKRLLGIVLLTAATAVAQRTQTEVVKPTTPQQDARANSAEVPEAYAIETQFERVVLLRFKYKTDLLAGMEKVIAKQGIHNAVILAGAGSVRNYHIHAVSNREFPSKNVYTKDPTAPADIVSMNGYVINGRIHAHMTMANGEHAFGGHLEPGTNVFTFAIVTLGVLPDDLDLTKIDDKTYR